MIWIHENFLKDNEIDELLNMNLKGFNHISNTNTKPLMSNTAMSYRICSIDIYKPIYEKLNLLHNLDLSKKYHHLNMQYKKFEGGDFYALHAENPKIYGDWFYGLYLSDEVDGELIFPSKEDAKKEWTKGFQEMCNQFNVIFVDKTDGVFISPLAVISAKATLLPDTITFFQLGILKPPSITCC